MVNIFIAISLTPCFRTSNPRKGTETLLEYDGDTDELSVLWRFLRSASEESLLDFPQENHQMRSRSAAASSSPLANYQRKTLRSPRSDRIFQDNFIKILPTPLSKG
ncbi:hypothetical protein PN471_21030 [Aphanizomenon sp. CS-733/32]|uniref:hypothetical protein n=1 Tax=Aphanizomenon sp. CS-733/32 TaxID=3021715 RepID=UPI00232E2D8D|nr:hypothetical protein [Aphanizomenon sp. CS-733/32]MDB9311064.1 hypothetical protein [Aphanizomenon sp. CS-733/32]